MYSFKKRHYKGVRTYSVITTLLLNCVLFKICEGNDANTSDLSKYGVPTNIGLIEKVGDLIDPSNERVFSRKRRNPSPQPLAEVLGSSSLNSGSSYRIAQEQVQNSHKPKFERCDEYQPSVEEESARGNPSTLI